jgi:aromatic-L-amino-acid decarboxylase
VRPGQVRDSLPREAPRVGEPIEAIRADFERLIVPALTHWNHPRFFAYFNSSSSGPAILAEILAAALNVNTMLWKTGPAATELEQVVLGWLRDMLGLPSKLSGWLHEGGSSSTLHALAAARQRAIGSGLRHDGLRHAPRLRVYVSEQTHSSVDKALMTLGLGLGAMRRVVVDAEYRMRADALRAAVVEDRRAGLLPCCVVATIGSTSCTSIDPVEAIAQVCASEGLWLHVDAAHGGALALLPERRSAFAGWEQADSIVINPHKWLMVPLDASALYTRHPEVLREAFSLVPAYLTTLPQGEVEDAMDYGITLGRRFRALKLWFTLRYFGQQGLRARLREHLRLAQQVARRVDAHPLLERAAPVPMSTVCLRACPPQIPADALDAFNRRWLEAIDATGRLLLSPTELDGRFVLRFVVSGLRTTARHVEEAWQTLELTLQQLLAGARGRSTLDAERGER